MRKQSTLWIRPYQLQLIDLKHPLLHTINCSTSTICVCWLIGKSSLLHHLVLLHLQWNLWFRERDTFAVCSNPGTARLPAVSCVARWGQSTDYVVNSIWIKNYIITNHWTPSKPQFSSLPPIAPRGASCPKSSHHCNSVLPWWFISVYLLNTFISLSQ